MIRISSNSVEFDDKCNIQREIQNQYLQNSLIQITTVSHQIIQQRFESVVQTIRIQSDIHLKQLQSKLINKINQSVRSIINTSNSKYINAKINLNDYFDQKQIKILQNQDLRSQEYNKNDKSKKQVYNKNSQQQNDQGQDSLLKKQQAELLGFIKEISEEICNLFMDLNKRNDQFLNKITQNKQKIKDEYQKIEKIVEQLKEFFQRKCDQQKEIQTKYKTEIEELRRRFKKQILINQKNLYEQFQQNQKKENQIALLHKENTHQVFLLKNHILELQKQNQLLKKLLEKEQEVTDHLQKNHLLIQQQIMIRLQEKIQASIGEHKQSRQTSDNLNFQSLEQQQLSMIQPQWMLLNKIEQLQNQLQLRDQMILGLQKYLNEAQSIDSGEIKKTVNKVQIKEKYKQYCVISQENAYLKKCLEKLTKSEIFWSSFKEKQLQDIQDEEDNPKVKKDTKCQIF